MHELRSYFSKLQSDKGSVSYLFTGPCALMRSREADGRNGNQKSVALSAAPVAAFFLRFFNRNRAGKPIYQGVPSSNRDVKPARKTGRVAARLASNMLFYRLAVWRGRGVGTPELRGTLSFRKTEGKKRKMESRYRGLPVWDADLRVNLFSCLTSLSPSKTNRAPNSHAG